MPTRVLFILLTCSSALLADEPAPADAAREVLPMLRRSCFECHGPQQQRGKLRLDSRAALLAGGNSGPAIVAGQPDQSELMRRIRLKRNEQGAMPSRGEPLTARDINRLHTWIAAGAPWPTDAASQHWAYVAPKRPLVPEIRNPKFDIRNPIDAFVLDRLQRERLEPSPPADPAILLRRLTLDLTGLPPTPQEADEFLNDRDPNVYERWVKRLLASPAFGERWARPWLDLARYADSHGFQRDDLRDLWPYRDWVIRALNDDMPFDQFTIEQLAGDLLPRSTESQLVATGFHRCAPISVEAGTDPEEARINQVFDRVNTTAAVWLGTTLECCQCHDHKYDPFTQREYYQFFAFFNSTAKEAERANPNVPGSIRFQGPKISYRGATTQIMEELPQPRPTFVLKRGDFRSPGERVQPGTPAVLPPLTSPHETPNRLDLARWLVARENPLTARVVVNRLWAELFGQGLVTTPEDFGTRGDPPSHPELLDWLAVEFMESGWSTKHLLQLIVLSSTYRQSSKLTPTLRDRDPANRLLARGPRFRLDAEAIRDQALAAAGLLYRRQGGVPARPPQPAGFWSKVGGEKIDYQASPAPEKYRRGIYVIWKRSSPYPSMVNFDATARLTCTVRRSRSNTPLQALTLLNDPVYVEAAQALANRVARERPSAPLDDQLRYAFRLCLTREPRPAELSVLRSLYRRQSSAAGPPPMQAVAAVLLNLDETITKP